MLTAEVRTCLGSARFMAFATCGSDPRQWGGCHVVATRCDLVEVEDDRTLSWPGGGLSVTESNLRENPGIQAVFLADGPRGIWGYRLEGTGRVETSGPRLERLQARHSWVRAVVVMTVAKVVVSKEIQFLNQA